MNLLAVFGSILIATQVPVVQPTTPQEPAKVPKPVPQATPQQMNEFIAELRAKNLQLPITGAKPDSLKGSFYQGRETTTLPDGTTQITRMHRAADFMAPRGTAIFAVDDGRIRRIFNSKAGGLSVYQLDPTNRFVYYYAHLDSYAPDLNEGNTVRKGQLIGYVGSTGNANPDAPHLHFAIWQTTPANIWNGIAVDPYEVFRNGGSPAQAVQPRQLIIPRHVAIPTEGGIWI